PLAVALDTLVNPTAVGTDTPGPMAHFDPAQPYAWRAVTWAGTYTGPADAAALDAATAFDTAGFLNPVRGTFGWSLGAGGQSLAPPGDPRRPSCLAPSSCLWCCSPRPFPPPAARRGPAPAQTGTRPPTGPRLPCRTRPRRSSPSRRPPSAPSTSRRVCRPS